MFVLACVYLPVVLFPSVGDRVIEEERAEAYVSEGKFHRPLRERLHPCEDV